MNPQTRRLIPKGCQVTTRRHKSEAPEDWPSAANFIWVFPDNPDAIEQHLRNHNILVRPKADQSGRKGLRVTLGDITQTQHLIDKVQEVLSSSRTS